MKQFKADPETLQKLIAKLTLIVDDPRISSQSRRKAEQSLRNVRVLQKEQQADPGASPSSRA